MQKKNIFHARVLFSIFMFLFANAYLRSSLYPTRFKTTCYYQFGTPFICPKRVNDPLGKEELEVSLIVDGQFETRVA